MIVKSQDRYSTNFLVFNPIEGGYKTIHISRQKQALNIIFTRFII